MPQSPELAGGEGFTFEGDAAAFYLSALLAEAYAPGIDDRIVVCVSVQQRDFGEPLDDVIVDFEDVDKNLARLSLQIKRSLTISKARTNSDFREIIHDSWATLKKTDFRINVDRYGAATGTITPSKERALKTLCDWARESLTADHFTDRFAKCGNVSEHTQTVKNDVVALLKEAKGTPCTNEEVHQFFAHFVLIRFDFLREGATDPPEAMNRIRDCLAHSEVEKTPLVWSRIVQLARSSAGKAGQINRARLVQTISPLARLRGANSLRQDLERLTEQAQNSANLITDDVGGIKLARASILKDLNFKLTTARLVQVRGLPGSGKSVVIKRAVKQALGIGPVLFLKAEQLEGSSWASYAISQGLSATSLERLLVEVGAVGTPVFFIDAIDRIGKEKQPIILDVIRTIVESPLLTGWQIVASLRDSGVELLRNWLSDFLDIMKIETLSIHELNDEDAEKLAQEKPHLRPLLFGSNPIKNIVRRPFFAKVLHQNFMADPSVPTLMPQSEVDLIKNWWTRGGYNETGQSAIERQCTLLNLARSQARQPNQPIRISSLNSITQLDSLIADGVLQNIREGLSIRFSHDIFFEWAFFYVLADGGPKWIDEIKCCGEPPAIARVVELSSQWEYAHGTEWPVYLTHTQNPSIRPQWTRAWLTGPLGSSLFMANEPQFEKVIFANDFYFLRKLLVWFQAEKTVPNPNILDGDLPKEKRSQLAIRLSWPSDFSAWHRLLSFILKRISAIPEWLYPDIIPVFQVWQNALANHPNETSHAILQQCATLLKNATKSNKSPETRSTIPDLDAFNKSVRGIILRASRSEPEFSRDLLQQLISTEHIEGSIFSDIIDYSPILAQYQPKLIAELTLQFLRTELPDETVARLKQESLSAAKWRADIKSKPKSERSRFEEMALLRNDFIDDFDTSDYFLWERLSIHDDHLSFAPPSPLREPFHALFKSSPSEALQLLRGLCNHAITAWLQLHQHSHGAKGTPLPLTVTFPWGTQNFWGTNREYLWFRGYWAPAAISSGLMALEEWCIAESTNGRPVDELIHLIVEGNECIAVLGIAAAIALHTKVISDAIVPLFTSQRLLAADYDRWKHDYGPQANLMGFLSAADVPHMTAIKAANERPIRTMHLHQTLPRLIFSQGAIGKQIREAILNFKSDLPFLYQEDCSDPEVKKSLTIQAHKYAEMIDMKTYKRYQTAEDPNKLIIVHESPTDSEPENIAKIEAANETLCLHSLWMWAYKSLEETGLSGSYTIADALTLAKGMDSDDLFVYQSVEDNDEGDLEMRRGAVAATAAVVLNLRTELTYNDLKWARGILGRAVLLPENPDPYRVPNSQMPWHHAIYVARGFAADIRHNTSLPSTAHDLLGQIAHPLEVVSLVAVKEACSLWSVNPRLTWAALALAFSICEIKKKSFGRVELHSGDDEETTVQAALNLYDRECGWPPLPLPPPAWVKVKSTKVKHTDLSYIDPETNDVWTDSDVLWHSKQAAEILQLIPFSQILNSNVKDQLINFLTGALDWTMKKCEPPWLKSGKRDRSATEDYEWIHILGSRLGHVAGLMPLVTFRSRFLDQILLLEGDNCWKILSPFVSAYVCEYIYDAAVVPPDAIATLSLCLERLLQDSAFRSNYYRSGELTCHDQRQLVDSLMFISIERADLAARYVNGDWSELSLILPLIDRFVRAAGWATSVLEPYLMFCDRAKGSYPADDYADQILTIISHKNTNLNSWKGTYIPSNIADLVHHFAHRDAPMTPFLAQKFLRILDTLVDMGDRRSAALQLGEAFRNVRLSS